MRNRSICLLHLVLVSVLLLCLGTGQPVLAQLGTATISGNVIDPTGAVVVGVSVTAVNSERGFVRNTVTNSLGQYNLPGLTPGRYDLALESAGFRRAQRLGLVLQVDQNLRLNVTMELGEVTETVEITAEAPLIESQSATLGAVIDTQKILALPLNGRNFVQLAYLVPGVTTGTGAGGESGFSASGLRADQNAFQIDGTSNTDSFRNRISVRPNIDSLQEFKIQTNNYSAEFGKGAGAQVNIITKSGTREFHGTFWEFLRNDRVQARNFFDRNSRSFPCDPSDPNVSTRPACAPQYNQNQFGANLGGPIAQRTFFFATFEGFRQRRGNATVSAVMMPAQRQGDFSQNLLSTSAGTDALGRGWQRGQLFDPTTSVQTPSGRFARDPFLNNRVPVTMFDPVSARMVANTEFMPLPNAAGARASDGDITENWLDSRSNRSDSEQFSGRVDHQFSDNDTVYGRYSFQDARTYSPNTFPGFGTVGNERRMNASLNYSKVFTPTTIGEFRFGYQGWFTESGAEDGLAGRDWIGDFKIPGLSVARESGILGSPVVNITSFAGLGNGNGPTTERNHTYQPLAILSVTKGKHFLKFGGELRTARMNMVRPDRPRGTFQFDTRGWTGVQGLTNTGHEAAAFLLGLSRQKSRLVADFQLNYWLREWGVFIQDDYKVTNNLTLNIGLRYMYYTPPYDDNDDISSWVQPANCLTFAECGPNYIHLSANDPRQSFFGVAGRDIPRSLSKTDKNNLGPRFGFAWQPFGNAKTVIRGGYGIFWETTPVSVNADSLYNYPQVIEDQQDLGLSQHGLPVAESFFGFLHENPGLGDGGPGSVAQFNPGPNNYAADFSNAYVQSWNFGIQRELPGQMVVELSYVGTKGTALQRQEVLNLAEPLGPYATWGDLSNDPTIRADIGPAGRNQMRRLVPLTVEQGVIIPLSNVFEESSSSFSTYHAGQLRLEKRFSRGLTYITTYSFSKAISDAPGFGGGGAGTGGRYQNQLDRKSEKGLADLDHRHRFTTAVVYELPGKGMLLGGWAVDGIIQLQSGFPMTPRRSGDPGAMGTNDVLRTDMVAGCDPDLPRGQQTWERFFNIDCYIAPEIRYGFASRSTLQGPGIIGIDLSLRKELRFGEAKNLQLRAEFFNAFNHPNFGTPNRNFGTGSFGRVTSAGDPRIIQFGLKFAF